MNGFTRHAIVREALANALAHRLLASILVIISALAPLVALTLTISDVHAIAQRQLQLEARGASVFSVTASDRTPISALRCDALGSVTGVRSAGSVVAVDDAHSSLPGGRHVPLLSATPGLATVLWPELLLDDGVAVGAGIADDLGLVPGSSIATTRGILPVTAVAPPSSRNADHDLLVVQQVAPRGTTRECLVESEPGARDGVEAVLVGWFPGVPTTVVPYFLPPDTGLSPQEELASRLSAWVPLAAAGLAALAMIAWWVIRRPEFALYSVLGLGTNGLALMLVAEWAVLCLLPGAIGIVNALVASSASLTIPAVAQVAAADTASYLASIILVPLVGVALLTRVAAVDALKGR